MLATACPGRMTVILIVNDLDKVAKVLGEDALVSTFIQLSCFAQYGSYWFVVHLRDLRLSIE